MFEHLDGPKATLLAISLALAGFLLRFAYERWWRRKDESEKSDKTTLKDHGERLMVVERRLSVEESKNDDRQRALGRLEADQSVLEGKVIGLQDFWRSEFGNLRKELRDDQQKLRDELRHDQASIEGRLTVLLVEHQKRVHDRLNVIAADQAKMLTDFVDGLVEKKAEPEAA